MDFKSVRVGQAEFDLAPEWLTKKQKALTECLLFFAIHGIEHAHAKTKI